MPDMEVFAGAGCRQQIGTLDGPVAQAPPLRLPLRPHSLDVGFTKTPNTLARSLTPPNRPASSPQPRQVNTAIVGTTTQLMTDNTRWHLQEHNLGPGAVPILSRMAAILEAKWEDGGVTGTEFARVDDALQDEFNKLEAHHKVNTIHSYMLLMETTKKY